MNDKIVSYNFDSDEHCVKCTLAIFEGEIPDYSKAPPPARADDRLPAPMTEASLSEVHPEGIACDCGEVLCVASSEEDYDSIFLPGTFLVLDY